MRDGRITVRRATVEDIPAILRLRRLMFESMGFNNTAQLDAADSACAAYFARAIRLDEYCGWVAVDHESKVVACGGLVVNRHPPGPGNLEGRYAYIMNMVTDPAYRRRGLARLILAEIMAWVRSKRIAVASLHATDMGRALYKGFGFRPGNEMTTSVCCVQE